MRDIEIESLFADALAPAPARRINGASGPWRLPRGPGEAAASSIAVEGRWASVYGRSPVGGRTSPLEALSAEAGWPGGVKRAETGPPPGQRSVALRADIPLLLDTTAGREWFVCALSAAVTGMRQAISAATPPATPPPMPPPRSSPTSSPLPTAAAGAAPDPELLAFACQAGGWNTEVRGDGTVHLDLPLRGAHRTIVLEARDHEIRASMQLGEATLSRAAAICLSAAGALLWRASAAMRWARAFAIRVDGADDGEDTGTLAAIGFECSLATPHLDAALLLAVETLIAAGELFGRELEVLLEQPDLAARFLRLHGGAGPAADEVDSARPFPPPGAKPVAPGQSHPAPAGLA